MQGEASSGPELTSGLWLVLDLMTRVRQWVRAPQDLVLAAFSGPWLWGVRLSRDDEPQIARYFVAPPWRRTSVTYSPPQPSGPPCASPPS